MNKFIAALGLATTVLIVGCNKHNNTPETNTTDERSAITNSSGHDMQPANAANDPTMDTSNTAGERLDNTTGTVSDPATTGTATDTTATATDTTTNMGNTTGTTGTTGNTR